MDNSLSLDVERNIVMVGGKSVHLAPKELEILTTLIESRGVVLSREALLNKCWGVDGETEMDARTVDQHVARLRNKLGATAHLVRTVARKGYAFQGPVEKPHNLRMSKSLESQILTTLKRLNGLLIKANKHG